MNAVKTARPIHGSVQHQTRSLLTGENNDCVNNLCGRWLRLSSGRLLWVHFNQKRTVARKTVAQDEWSLMTGCTRGFTGFARLIIIMYFYDLIGTFS